MLFAASLTLLATFALGQPWSRTIELRSWSLQQLGVVLGRGLLVGYALGLASYFLLASVSSTVMRAVLAWDIGSAIFLVLSVVSMTSRVPEPLLKTGHL